MSRGINKKVFCEPYLIDIVYYINEGYSFKSIAEKISQYSGMAIPTSAVYKFACEKGVYTPKPKERVVTDWGTVSDERLRACEYCADRNKCHGLCEYSRDDLIKFHQLDEKEVAVNG